MSRFANLADKPKVSPKLQPQPAAPSNEEAAAATVSVSTPPRSSSRVGLKAIAAYFSPEMSLAVNRRAKLTPYRRPILALNHFCCWCRSYADYASAQQVQLCSTADSGHPAHPFRSEAAHHSEQFPPGV